MNKSTKYKVYWTDENELVHSIELNNLITTLSEMERLRKEGNSFVSMVSESIDRIGIDGTDSITDGILPSGQSYDWKKRR